MPISFDLEALRKQHGCEIYLETGLYDPREDVSCRKALESNFDRVYSIEIREDWVELGRKEFAPYIEAGKLRLIKDDSTNLIVHMQHDNPDFMFKKVLFFLDAHVDNDDIKGYKKRCPLFEELKAIQQLPRNDHVICIDDLRILAQQYPWEEESYGNISFLDMMIKLIQEINPNYKFTQYDGFIPNDVLVAYV